MMRMVLSACTLLALCGCWAEKRQDVLETRLKELESLFRYINTREERNSYRQDIELREIRRFVGLTNGLPTVVAENGGGGPSPEYAQLAARLASLEEWQRAVDADVNEIKMTDYASLLEIVVDISRLVDRTCHRQDALSNRLDRLEQRLAGETNEVTVIVSP